MKAIAGCAVTRRRPLTSACSPRTRIRAPVAASTSSSPARSVPARSVPVTTLPAPPIVNAWSTHNRTSPPGPGPGRPATSRASSARNPASPSPETPLTATAGSSPSEVLAMRHWACRRGPPGARRTAASTPHPRRRRTAPPTPVRHRRARSAQTVHDRQRRRTRSDCRRPTSSRRTPG